MWKHLLLVIPLLGIASGSFLPAERNYECKVQNTNPYGECGCDGQLFLNETCSEAFYCFEDLTGCLATCNEDELIMFDPKVMNFMCVEKTEQNVQLCPGAVITNCGCVGDEECDFIDCECENQVQISPDCSKARKCRSRFPDGYQKFQCKEPGTIVHMNPDNYYLSCIEDDGRCPNVSTHTPCDFGQSTTEPPENPCNFTKNPLGSCNCNRQLFVNDDCTEGFYCVEGLSGQPEGTEGCLLQCKDDEFLIVEPDNYMWKCVKKTDQKCPGKFHVDCPCTGDSCGFGECECPGQLWISEDCKKGKYCLGGLIDHREFACMGLNQIISITDPETGAWECITDDQRCPGAFHVPENCTTEVPPGNCTPSANLLGTCECDRQLFIGNQCTEGFFCLDEGVDGEEGCMIDCPEDHYVAIDRVTDSWKCMPKSGGGMAMVCPGDFKTSCRNTGLGECECAGQLWVSSDCRMGKYCNSTAENDFSTISCDDGQRIEVDLMELTWSCIEDDGKCLGELSTQCQNATEPPVETTTSGVGKNTATLAVIGLLSLLNWQQ